MKKITVKYIGTSSAQTKPMPVEVLPTKEDIDKALGAETQTLDLGMNLRMYYTGEGACNRIASQLVWEFLRHTMVVYGPAVVSGSLGEFPDNLPDWMR